MWCPVGAEAGGGLDVGGICLRPLGALRSEAPFVGPAAVFVGAVSPVRTAEGADDFGEVPGLGHGGGLVSQVWRVAWGERVSAVVVLDVDVASAVVDVNLHAPVSREQLFALCLEQRGDPLFASGGAFRACKTCRLVGEPFPISLVVLRICSRFGG